MPPLTLPFVSLNFLSAIDRLANFSALNGNLIAFLNRWCCHVFCEFAHLLLVVATLLICNSVLLTIPYGNRITFTCCAICEKRDSTKSLLWFCRGDNAVFIAFYNFINFIDIYLNYGKPCKHKYSSFLFASKPIYPMPSVRWPHWLCSIT